MAVKSKGDGSGRKRPGQDDKPIGEPVVVASSETGPVSSVNAPDLWAKLLDQSPWTAKAKPRGGDETVITQRVARPQIKPDESLLSLSNVWKKPLESHAQPMEPVVVESTPLVITVPTYADAIVLSDEQPEQPAPVVDEALVEIPEPAPQVVQIDVDEPQAVETAFEGSAVAVEPEPAPPPPPPIATPTALLLAARLAEVAAIKAAMTEPAVSAEPEAHSEPEPEPEPESYPVEDSLVEALPVEEPSIEDVAIMDATSESPALEPVILPLTPPQITPYFERFAGEAASPQVERAASPQAERAASPQAERGSEPVKPAASGQTEIPVENLVGGLVSLVGDGASAAFSLGSKAVGGLWKGGASLGSYVVEKAGKIGCGTCATPNKTCEK